jgi:hypothetical protein
LGWLVVFSIRVENLGAKVMNQIETNKETNEYIQGKHTKKNDYQVFILPNAIDPISTNRPGWWNSNSSTQYGRIGIHPSHFFLIQPFILLHKTSS